MLKLALGTVARFCAGAFATIGFVAVTSNLRSCKAKLDIVYNAIKNMPELEKATLKLRVLPLGASQMFPKIDDDLLFFLAITVPIQMACGNASPEVLIMLYNAWNSYIGKGFDNDKRLALLNLLDKVHEGRVARFIHENNDGKDFIITKYKINDKHIYVSEFKDSGNLFAYIAAEEISGENVFGLYANLRNGIRYIHQTGSVIYRRQFPFTTEQLVTEDGQKFMYPDTTVEFKTTF